MMTRPGWLLGPALLILVLACLLPAARADEPKRPPPPGVPDAELQAAINAAIEKGGVWLAAQQNPNGSLGGIVTQGTTHHEVGTTALAGLALLAAGYERRQPEPGNPDEPTCVDRVYRYLLKRDRLSASAGSRSTYDAGTLLMFVTKYWREDEEEPARGHTRPGRRDKNPCNLPPDVLAWVQDVATWLVRVSKKPTFTWGYPAHRDDHSNTQYAFLGLRAARDCGAKIPPQVFLGAAKTMLERQEKDGPKRPRVVPSPDPDASPYVIDAGDRVRGWGYLPQPEPFVSSGSMTTAGIAILAICHDALSRPSKHARYDSKLERQVRSSIQDGFSWLDKYWTVNRNPGAGAPNWHYYYLYGLERACMFGGRDLVGQHDWYLEGARYLVAKQQEDGKWDTGFLGDETYKPSPIVDTAWAILFLARATRPMPPIQAPVVTPGDK